VYGKGGVLRALPPYTGPESRTPEKIAEARQARLGELHPLVQAFVNRQGIRRLSLLEVDDPEWGEVKRKELRDAWDRHVEAMADRDVAELVAGGERRPGLNRFDPLAALGASRPQIAEGSEV
jgi:hypothetical protein